jgi:hypothetical protein
MENSCNPLLHGEGQVTVSVSRCHAQLANERESKDARGTCQLIMIPNTKSLGLDRLARTGMATNPEPPQFRCKAGEPVPEVDPEDLKEVWKMTRDNRQMGFGAATAAQPTSPQPFNKQSGTGHHCYRLCRSSRRTNWRDSPETESCKIVCLRLPLKLRWNGLVRDAGRACRLTCRNF